MRRSPLATTSNSTSGGAFAASADVEIRPRATTATATGRYDRAPNRRSNAVRHDRTSIHKAWPSRIPTTGRGDRAAAGSTSRAPVLAHGPRAR